MKDVLFPVNFTFKISTFSNDFVAVDASAHTIAYIKQKMFKFIEEINVFSDETQTQKIYTIKANRWLDFSAAYNFYDKHGRDLGKVARKGWVSLWKAQYEIYNTEQQLEYTIQEENAWVKVLDGLIGEIPLLGMFTGYFFNPTYKVVTPAGTMVARLTKEASFWGRKFSVEKLSRMDGEAEQKVLLGLMMMILLERRRG